METKGSIRRLDFILFVDDEKANNYYHQYILKDSDLVGRTDSFDSSQEALAYFKSLATDAKLKGPELLFLDLNLPAIDGWEFLDRFQKIGLKNPPKIVLLTTSMNPKDLNRAANHPGVHAVSNKPLSIEKLMKIILSL